MLGASSRTEVTTAVPAGELLVREGMANGELPLWTDARALAAAFIVFLDGLLLWRLEAGTSFRRDEAKQRAYALLRPILAAAATAAPPVSPPVPAQPLSLADRS